MDDFDYDEQEELERKRQQQQQNNDSIVDRAKNAKDKYDNAKENIDTAKNIREKLRQKGNASKITGEAGQAAAKGAGETAAKGAGKAAAKGAGETAAKGAGKAAAEKAGQEVAKQAAKKAAVKGAVAASGAATAGVGTAAAVAMEARDQLKKAGKKLNDKFDNAVESATGLKLKGKKKFIIILIIFIVFFVIITTGSTYLASEDTYEDLAAIIKKRQTRYAESGKTFKPVLLMTNGEINEILTKDYLEPGQTLKDILNLKLDICYKTYLEDLYNEEYNNYIPSDSNDPNSTYEEKIAIIEKYLKASRSNFNKIKWTIFGGTGSVQMEKIDLKDNLSSAAALLLNIKDNYLSMPKLDKYKTSPSATADQMKTMYLDMVEKYLQPWVVPYALNIASQDNNFGKSVLEDMFHPINVTLYELDRLIRTTITYYYLETTVKIDHYTEEKYDCSDDDGDGHDECSTRWVYSSTSYQDSTTATTWEDTSAERYSVSLKSGPDGYIRAGIKSGPDVTRDQKPYRHVPKLTYVEAFYEIINAKYNIIPINEANTPVETSTTLDSDGKEVIIDIWDENLASNGVESKPYKVSYIGDENITFPRKTVSQKEQLKKKFYGVEATDTEESIPPQVQGYTYDDLAFGFAQIEKYYNTAATGGVIGSGSLTSIPAGGFAWPVPAILGSGVDIDNTISSPYGTRVHPITGAVSFHPAIDIGAMGIGNPGSDKNSSYGPDIVAAQSGIVNVKSNPNGYGPEYIIIDHQNGYYSLYGHLYSLSVTDGQTVTQGQTIGVMGTKGSSTGVHLHFGIYKGTSVNDVFNNSNALDPRQLYNDDGTAIGGVTNTGTVTSGTGSATTSGQSVIDQMCAKAQALADLINIKYKYGGETLSTIEELTKNPWNTDCSGFVSSMYKAYIGIDTGRDTGTMIQRGKAGYSENGWTAEYHDWDGDMSVLLPGDMLLRATHVGLYIGGGKQVDNGGPNEGDPGPKYRDARGTYTGYVRYTNPNVVTSTASENVTGSASNTAGSTNASGQKISRIEWYLDWQKAKNDSTGGTSTGGAVGSSDLVSFLILAEGGVDLLSADGTKYIVHDDGAGNPTVGMGVYIEANRDKFIARGIDPDSLTIGSEVDKSIVDEITTEELGYFIDKVNNTLDNAGITDLTDEQKNALISRAYNCGNINGFPSAYQQYGNTQALYDNYMSTPVTDNHGVYQPGLTKRREGEWQLFNTGVYPDTIY